MLCMLWNIEQLIDGIFIAQQQEQENINKFLLSDSQPSDSTSEDIHPRDGRCPKEKKILYISENDLRSSDDFASDEEPVRRKKLTPTLQQLDHIEILHQNKPRVMYRGRGRSRRFTMNLGRASTFPNNNNNNNNKSMYTYLIFLVIQLAFSIIKCIK